MGRAAGSGGARAGLFSKAGDALCSREERVVPAYSLSARIYDRLVGAYAFEQWKENFKRLRRRYDLELERVADVACGTGMATAFLAREAGEVFGCDTSVEMLREAAALCGGGVRLARQDMRYVSPPWRATLLNCSTDSLNHLLREEDIRRAFASFHAALAPGGRAVFDVNTIWQLREGADDKPWDLEIDGCRMRWMSTWDEDARIATVRFSMPEKAPGGGTAVEVHRERGYELEWLVGELREAGFKGIEALDAAGLGKVGSRTRRIQFMARA